MMSEVSPTRKFFFMKFCWASLTIDSLKWDHTLGLDGTRNRAYKPSTLEM